jgi:uncharacterized damage-inducible protein DinB
MKNGNEALLIELEKLLRGGSAHVGLKDALADLPEELLGERPHQLPYSLWQLLEHIRIAQADMLEFCKNANYQPLKWPDDYWPTEPAPAHKEAFAESLKKYNEDLEAFIELIHHEDLYTPLPHGDGQTVLREALQIADHTAYHVAEIIVIRRLLHAWKPS